MTPPKQEEESSRQGSGRLRRYGEAFLPGALAGTQVAGLLYFLNPHLPFDPLPVLSSVVFYSGLLGCACLIPTFLFAFRNRASSEQRLPVTLTLVLAAAGLSAWIHASYFSFYLPPGINRRLLKAAIWLSLSSLVCFYTTLLHRVRHRPYGKRSRALFTLMALASVYVVLERRDAFRPSLSPTPRPTTFQSSQRPRLFVVGIESATLDAILPLAEQGKLPFFNRMLQQGPHSRLSTLRPARRAALWTTLATGKFPYRHGVVGDRVYEAPFLSSGSRLNILPLGIAFKHWGIWKRGIPISAAERRVVSIWEILSRLGVPTALVGWPLTEPSDGLEIALSDRFFETDGMKQYAPSAELAERARLFRTDVGDIDPAITSRFGIKPPVYVLDALARDLWRRDLSLFLVDQEPQIDAFFVTLPGLAEISARCFGGYSAVQFKGLQEPTSEQAAHLVSAYYMHLDQTLASFWERTSAPRLLIVISANGAEGPQGWREARRLLLRRPALEGYVNLPSDGIMMFLGEGFQKGALLRPANLVDLVPTLLYGLGFPIARDLDGAVLTPAFETGFLARQPLTFLPSYETLAERTTASRDL